MQDLNALSSQLPPPDALAKAHSEQLVAHLRSMIAESGELSFSNYMQQVLYAPGLGYYAAGASKFGAEGDFVTAPEVSPLFAQCLSRQAQQVLSLCPGDVLELGAGSGVLAADFLQSFKHSDICPDRYFILEPSAQLQQRQQKLLQQRVPEWIDRIEWISELPDQFNGVIFGNEVVDAFPVEMFTRTVDGFQCLMVALDDKQLVWKNAEPDVNLLQMLQELEGDIGYNLQTGYRSELNALCTPWMASLSQSLQSGAILLLDYGYSRREFYLPERHEGTIRCYYRHHAHDNPFFYPGLQDITSHVDFSLLTKAAVESGLELQGYTTQNHFLMSNGLLELSESLMSKSNQSSDSLYNVKIAQQIRQLTMPGAMGDSFKAIAFSRGIEPLLHGFSGQDYSHQL